MVARQRHLLARHGLPLPLSVSSTGMIRPRTVPCHGVKPYRAVLAAALPKKADRLLVDCERKSAGGLPAGAAGDTPFRTRNAGRPGRRRNILFHSATPLGRQGI